MVIPLWVKKDIITNKKIYLVHPKYTKQFGNLIPSSDYEMTVEDFSV